MRKPFVLLLFPLVLASCVGSQFIVDETDDEAIFPDLHDVPERPDFPNSLRHKGLEEDLSSSQQKILEENERLRKQYGL